MSVLSQSLPALQSHLLPYDYWDFSLFAYIDYRTMLLPLSKIEEDLGDSSRFHFESANFNTINVTNAPWLSSKLVSRLLCVWKLYRICVVAFDCMWPTWQKQVFTVYAMSIVWSSTCPAMLCGIALFALMTLRFLFRSDFMNQFLFWAILTQYHLML